MTGIAALQENSKHINLELCTLTIKYLEKETIENQNKKIEKKYEDC